ncbi:MAG TPA: hypothetical protein VNQ48_04025, partial [Microbacteriaceae bacterium]|nr:hypothetical protein [Microbacteriaceae bacterium]
MTEAAAPARRAFRVELVIVILLGIASVATAYVTFQSSLWDSAMASEYTRGQHLKTEAEALYLEANQQYVQDAQTYAQLAVLGVDAISEDPAVAANAVAKIDALALTGIDDVLAAALEWSNATGEYPLGAEEYLVDRYGDYHDLQAQAAAHLIAGDQANAYSDQLTLYTVLLAIALFLLGVAAVVTSTTIKWGLIGVGSVIAVVAVVLTSLVPFAAVG